MGKALILFVALVLSGCTLGRDAPFPSDPRSIWCDQNSPRRDAKPETPRTEIDEITAHNAKGEKWCGWKP